jgi:hypothetical protein
MKLFTTDLISVNFLEYVELEALPGVVMKSSVFWDLTVCLKPTDALEEHVSVYMVEEKPSDKSA